MHLKKDICVFHVPLTKVTFSYSLQGEGEEGFFLAQDTTATKMLNALFITIAFLQNK